MNDLEQRAVRALIKTHKEIWPGSWYAMPEALQLVQAVLKARAEYLAEIPAVSKGAAMMEDDLSFVEHDLRVATEGRYDGVLPKTAERLIKEHVPALIAEVRRTQEQILELQREIDDLDDLVRPLPVCQP